MDTNIAKIVKECTSFVSCGKNADSLISQYQPIEYSCPVCGKTYATMQEAEACRDRPYDTRLKVGDIVVVPSCRYSYDIRPDDPWVAFVQKADKQSTSHFDHVDNAVPYFVVTAIHNDADSRRYHRTLVTLCRMYTKSDGSRTIMVGWNPANGQGHYAMFRPSDGERFDIGSTWYESLCKEIGPDWLDKCKPCATLKEEAATLAAIRISTRMLLG